MIDYYKDAPTLDITDDSKSRVAKDDREGKGRRERKGKKEGRPGAGYDKDRRTAEPGMARIYVNAGKSDGFYAGNLIDALNKNIPGGRVDVGRIDLMPGYSLFDVPKGDAAKVVGALKSSDFMGKRLYSEIASVDKDYAHSSDRKKKRKQ